MRIEALYPGKQSVAIFFIVVFLTGYITWINKVKLVNPLFELSIWAVIHRLFLYIMAYFVTSMLCGFLPIVTATLIFKGNGDLAGLGFPIGVALAHSLHTFTLEWDPYVGLFDESPFFHIINLAGCGLLMSQVGVRYFIYSEKDVFNDSSSVEGLHKDHSIRILAVISGVLMTALFNSIFLLLPNLLFF